MPGKRQGLILCKKCRKANGFVLWYVLEKDPHSEAYSISIEWEGVESVCCAAISENVDEVKTYYDMLQRNRVFPCHLFEVLEDLIG